MVELGGSEAARTRAPHSAVAGGRLRGWSAMTGHGQSVTHVPGIKRNLCVQNGPTKDGGEGGIRTPDTVARMPHFECGAFNHSATSPWPQKAQTSCRSAAMYPTRDG